MKRMNRQRAALSPKRFLAMLLVCVAAEKDFVFPLFSKNGQIYIIEAALNVNKYGNHLKKCTRCRIIFKNEDNGGQYEVFGDIDQ